MSLTNEIVLRPRFKIDLELDSESILKQFEAAKYSQKKYIISIIDEHIFIKLPKQEQQFWSPQLHLEVYPSEESNKYNSVIKGLFGPNPTIWTLFMFLHFIVAGIFIAFGIWAYSNWTLGNSYTLQLIVVVLMLIFWFILYFAGRIGKDTGKDEMMEMRKFLNTVLSH